MLIVYKAVNVGISTSCFISGNQGMLFSCMYHCMLNTCVHCILYCKNEVPTNICVHILFYTLIQYIYRIIKYKLNIVNVIMYICD